MNADRDNVQFRALDITLGEGVLESDLGILMEVFEHIPLDECEKFLAGVRLLLKSGARLLVTVPHANKPLEYKHYQHFTQDSLLPYFQKDFRVEKVIPFEKKAISRKLLDHLMCNRLFVLNNRRLLDIVYSYHKNHLFSCDGEKECQRLYVEAVAI